MTLPKAILIFLIGLCASQIVYYYPNLPENVASRFNAAGEADDWMSKNSYLLFQLVLLTLTAFFAFALPVLISRLPAHSVNMPNRDFWLAPERKRETFAILRRQFEWFGIALGVLLIGVNQLVIEANLANRNLSPASWILLGAFLLFVAVWSFRLCGKFRIVK